MINLVDLLFFSGLTATICGSISLMFLPAIMELKKPRDAGPRVIDAYTEKIGLNALTNLEDEELFPGKLSVEKSLYPFPVQNLEEAI